MDTLFSMPSFDFFQQTGENAFSDRANSPNTHIKHKKERYWMARQKRYAIAVLDKEEIMGERMNTLNYVCEEIVKDGNTPVFYSGIDYYMNLLVAGGHYIAAYDIDHLIKAYRAAKNILSEQGAFNMDRYLAMGNMTQEHPHVENADLISIVSHHEEEGLTYFCTKASPDIQWEILD